jgi:hypothetical protein
VKVNKLILGLLTTVICQSLVAGSFENTLPSDPGIAAYAASSYAQGNANLGADTGNKDIVNTDCVQNVAVVTVDGQVSSVEQNVAIGGGVYNFCR